MDGKRHGNRIFLPFFRAVAVIKGWIASLITIEKTARLPPGSLHVYN
jgi:hypothetical protein